jgi:hypothetical protein
MNVCFKQMQLGKALYTNSHRNKEGQEDADSNKHVEDMICHLIAINMLRT